MARGRHLICLLAMFSLAGVLVAGWDRGRGATLSPGVQFVDVAHDAGLDHRFKAPIQPIAALTILETVGNGCAFIDYDHDGNLDVLLVNERLALYRGDGRGHFQNVTHRLGLDKARGHFLGCAAGDYDNDGYTDLYISGFGTGLLLHNERGEAFRDVTRRASLKPQPWGSSCGFADLNHDGLLDLFIANYVEFGTDPNRYLQRCEPLACGPEHYDPELPTLYRNFANGRFADVSLSSGVRRSKGKGLAVGFADYDDDGDQDILVANDMVACDLFQNTGAGRFSNQGVAAGTAFGVGGNPQAGMGVDWADYDGDGRLDAVVTNYTEQPRSLYRNEGNGLFTNTPQHAGIAEPTKPFLAFGVKWLDYDNDGWPDLIVANGNVDNKIAIMVPGTTYRQPTQVFRNLGAHGRAAFVNESGLVGEAVQRPIVGRGLATGDFDNDGRIDALIVDDDGPVLLLHNERGKTGHWIGLSLIGTGRSNRDALGARVTVTARGRTQVREVQTAGSYLSASDPRLHFGLGKATAVAAVSVRWPDGRSESFEALPVDQYHTLRQGEGRPADFPPLLPATR